MLFDFDKVRNRSTNERAEGYPDGSDYVLAMGRCGARPGKLIYGLGWTGK